MLQQFTWYHFLIAASVLALVWYLAILLYYRGKVFHLIPVRFKQKQPEKLKREWDEELEEPENEDEDLIGKQAVPEGVSEVNMHQLGFAPKAKSEEDGIHEDNRFRRSGLIPDVLEELKSIFRILEKENEGKEDFFSLFALISAKYPKIKGTPNQQALNDYIRENLPFEIAEEELDKLWNNL